MSNLLCFDSGIESPETIVLQETQVALNEFFKDCHEGVRGIETKSVRRVGVGGHGKASGCCCAGVGGHRESSGDCAGVGGESSGGASRKFGGKEVEYTEQRGGKVWRFEAVGVNRGTGVDSSEKEF